MQAMDDSERIQLIALPPGEIPLALPMGHRPTFTEIAGKYAYAMIGVMGDMWRRVQESARAMLESFADAIRPALNSLMIQLDSFVTDWANLSDPYPVAPPNPFEMAPDQYLFAINRIRKPRLSDPCEGLRRAGLLRSKADRRGGFSVCNQPPRSLQMPVYRRRYHRRFAPRWSKELQPV